MTPREIDEVVGSWRAARSQHDVLRAAITAQLPEGAMPAEERADWIMQTVDCLHPLLASPNELADAAIEMAMRRKVVTSAELRCDRLALLSGIETVTGSLTAECTNAWHRAFGLFGDVIAGLILNPFLADEASPCSNRGR